MTRGLAYVSVFKMTPEQQVVQVFFQSDIGLGGKRSSTLR